MALSKLAEEFPIYNPWMLTCYGYVRQTQPQIAITIPTAISEIILKFTSSFFNDCVTVKEDQDDDDDENKLITKFFGINKICSTENKIIWKSITSCDEINHQFFQQVNYTLEVESINSGFAIIGFVAAEGPHQDKYAIGFASDGSLWEGILNAKIKRFNQGSVWSKGDKYGTIYLNDTKSTFNQAWILPFPFNNNPTMRFFMQFTKGTKIKVNAVEYFQTNRKTQF